MPYDKHYLSVDEQLDLLASRGMALGDREAAAHCLKRIGYYRLKSYWQPFRERSLDEWAQDESRLLEIYRPGTEFRYGVELYVFDKKLRLLMMDALERIEVALRVALAHTIGARDKWAHHNIDHLDPNRAIDGSWREEDESDAEPPSELGPPGPDVGQGAAGPRDRPARPSRAYEKWKRQADIAEENSPAKWVREFRSSYGPLPIWMAVELWGFGLLSRLLEMARQPDRMTIARRFQVPNPELLVSWVRCLAVFRNACAHHARVWNNSLVSQPTAPKNLPDRYPAAMLAHLSESQLMRTRVYGAIAVAQYFMKTINPGSSWNRRMREHWDKFPPIPGVSPEQSGFYPGWQERPLWR